MERQGFFLPEAHKCFLYRVPRQVLTAEQLAGGADEGTHVRGDGGSEGVLAHARRTVNGRFRA